MSNLVLMQTAKIKRTLNQRIQAWQNGRNTLVNVGGIPQAQWATDDLVYIHGGTSGRTIVSRGFAMRQDCIIKQIKVNVMLASGAVWKFKLFRWNNDTSVFDFVAEQTFTPTTGVNTITISPALSAQMGDIVGLFVPGTSNANKVYTGSARDIGTRYATGDINTSNALASTTGTSCEMDVLGYSPYLTVTGDSIPEGHNGTTLWHGALHDIGVSWTYPTPGGDPTCEISNQVRGLIGNGMTLEYQNLSLGSQDFSWVASTGIVACLAVKPNRILIHCGINDVSGGRSWADVDTDLDTIAVAIAATSPVSKLLIDEILPWTAGTDGQAATLRTFNTNLAAWCTANGATLVRCHDAMGQIRVATGELDNLKTAYDQDAIHLTPAGINALAAIWKKYL